jgi:lipopolysaccharide/colanic/teichoic acid biosynthesis glycosyltransferase
MSSPVTLRTGAPPAPSPRPLRASVSTLPRLTAARYVPIGPEPRARRIGEFLLAGTLVLVLAPVLLVLALLVKSTSRGPVLFRHERVGAGGHPFCVLKFRSMHDGAESRLRELHALNDGAGPLFKIRDDPRITMVGRWMRRFSLDELPQLFNVLGGSMSLVGPRPSSPPEVARFLPSEHRRHVVRPGLTGLAQINGRSDLSWEDTLRYDLHYVDHRSLRLDLLILLRTLPAILGGRGAY